MSGTICLVLEELGHDSSLELDLNYDYTPGEKMVRYFRDGSGDPGCPPSAEWTSISVTTWRVGEETRLRSDHWVWSALDKIAESIIERDWHERYEELCLSDADREEWSE